MNDWLAKLAEKKPSGLENLEAELESLPPEDLNEIAYDMGVADRPGELDELYEKMATADALGRELAYAHGDELEKTAAIPAIAAIGARALPLLGRLGGSLGGKGALKGMAKNVAMDTVQNAAVNKLTGAASRPAQQAAPAAPAMAGGGGFKFASATSRLRDEAMQEWLEKEANVLGSVAKSVGTSGRSGGFLRGMATMAKKDPRRFMMYGGAAIGAAKGLIEDPGIDPQTGQPRSRLMNAAKQGLVGGGIGYGVGSIKGVQGRVSQWGADAQKGIMDASKQIRQEGGSLRARTGQGGQLARSTGARVPVKPAAEVADAPVAAAATNAPAAKAVATPTPQTQVPPPAGNPNEAAEVLRSVRQQPAPASAPTGTGVLDQVMAGMPAAQPPQSRVLEPQPQPQQPSFFRRLLGRHSPAAAGARASQPIPAGADVAGPEWANVTVKAAMAKYAAMQGISLADLSPMERVKLAMEYRALVEKVANMQRLTYDPATKSFTRLHLTDDTSLVRLTPNDPMPIRDTQGSIIRSGTSEIVGQNRPVESPRSGPNPSAVRSRGVPGAMYEGGGVLSSAPRPGMRQVAPAARPATSPPPLPAAAMRPRSPAAAGAQALGAAAAKAPAKLPSMAGFKSLVGRVR